MTIKWLAYKRYQGEVIEPLNRFCRTHYICQVIYHNFHIHLFSTDYWDIIWTCDNEIILPSIPVLAVSKITKPRALRRLLIAIAYLVLISSSDFNARSRLVKPVRPASRVTDCLSTWHSVRLWILQPLSREGGKGRGFEICYRDV